MDEEEIKAMQEENAKLKKDAEASDSEKDKEITDLKKEVEDQKVDIEKLGKDIEGKDEVIDKKNKDIVGARKQYNKLKELSAEEKEAMTQKEIELHDATLELQKKQEDFEKTQTESRDKETNERKSNAFKKIVGDDEELLKKIETNYDLIKGSDKAQTQEEISKLAEAAFNMSGIERPASVTDALNSSNGKPSGTQGDKDFSDTSEGKDLGSKLGLEQTNNTPTPKEKKPVEEGDGKTE